MEDQWKIIFCGEMDMDQISVKILFFSIDVILIVLIKFGSVLWPPHCTQGKEASVIYNIKSNEDIKSRLARQFSPAVFQPLFYCEIILYLFHWADDCHFPWFLSLLGISGILEIWTLDFTATLEEGTSKSSEFSGFSELKGIKKVKYNYSKWATVKCPFMLQLY